MTNRRAFFKQMCVSAVSISSFPHAMRGWGEATIQSAGSSKPWWKTGVLYQIYPRSFQDSNGDGLGDFPGMTSRLGHLRSLGVDAVWITACFDSPNADNGYDVRDYRRISPDFGSMEDFDGFMAEAKEQGIRVILDMVFNHSSDEHEWFKQSRLSRDNPYRDYYFWRDPVNGGPPTNWPSAFGGSAWEFDKTTGQYYLHHYATKQPDLNWENPKVRHELYAILNFWAAKGVSGFRFDCAGEISKPLPFRDMTPAELNDNVIDYRTTGSRLDEYFKEMRAATSDYPDLYLLGEGWGMPRDRILRAIDDRNHELSSAFRFDFMLQNIQDSWRNLPWSLQRLKDFNKENQFDDDPHAWPIVFLEDHDFSRSVSRFGSSRAEYQDRSAKLLATMLLSLRGTPLIYQGEEIGMSNYPFTAVSQYNDIGVYNLYKDLVETGKVSSAEYLANNAITSRDNSRTPMQWDTSTQAGFTKSTKPWLAVNPNYKHTNVESESGDKDSVLSFYRDMIRLRKSEPTLIFGSYRDVSGDQPHLYAYERAASSGKLMVLLNFSDEPTEFHLPVSFRPKRVLMNNVAKNEPTLAASVPLLPWQALILG